MDQIPEFATRLGVDAGGRLVEQQQFRLMQHAGGEREALLPAAGELTGELIGPVGKSHARHDTLDRGATIVHLIDAGDEVEIFEDGQVFVEAEFLRHVADVAADQRRLADDVEAEALTFAAVWYEQAAQHADRRRLAAAVCAEKTADFSLIHLERKAFDDLACAKALAQILDVDDVRAH